MFIPVWGLIVAGVVVLLLIYLALVIFCAPFAGLALFSVELIKLFSGDPSGGRSKK